MDKVYKLLNYYCIDIEKFPIPTYTWRYGKLVPIEPYMISELYLGGVYMRNLSSKDEMYLSLMEYAYAEIYANY